MGQTVLKIVSQICRKDEIKTRISTNLCEKIKIMVAGGSLTRVVRAKQCYANNIVLKRRYTLL